MTATVRGPQARQDTLCFRDGKRGAKAVRLVEISKQFSLERMPRLGIFIPQNLFCASSRGSKHFLLSVSLRGPTAVRQDEQYRTEGLGKEREPGCPAYSHGCFLGL